LNLSASLKKSCLVWVLIKKSTFPFGGTRLPWSKKIQRRQHGDVTLIVIQKKDHYQETDKKKLKKVVKSTGVLSSSQG